MIGQPPRIGTRGPATLSHGIRLISNREERLGQTHQLNAYDLGGYLSGGSRVPRPLDS
jgi:hypothetical protein